MRFFGGYNSVGVYCAVVATDLSKIAALTLISSRGEAFITFEMAHAMNKKRTCRRLHPKDISSLSRLGSLHGGLVRPQVTWRPRTVHRKMSLDLEEAGSGHNGMYQHAPQHPPGIPSSKEDALSEQESFGERYPDGGKAVWTVVVGA